jgi:hypothetical protein
MAMTAGNGTAFQRRTTLDGASAHTAGPTGALPRWVRLVRSGNTITGSTSTDGSQWTTVGNTTIAFSGAVRIGLAVTAHTNTTLCTAVFDQISVVTGAVDTTEGGLGTVSARGQNGTHEGMLKAFDNASSSKWLDFAPDASTRASWIQYSYATGTLYRVTSYTITSANDVEARDPKDWALLGSNDGGTTWTPVDTRSGETFSERFQKRTFSVTTPDYYKAYRLRIDAVRTPAGANSVQLSEIELLSAEPAMNASGG